MQLTLPGARVQPHLQAYYTRQLVVYPAPCLPASSHQIMLRHAPVPSGWEQLVRRGLFHFLLPDPSPQAFACLPVCLCACATRPPASASPLRRVSETAGRATGSKLEEGAGRGAGRMRKEQRCRPAEPPQLHEPCKEAPQRLRHAAAYIS